MAVNPFIAALGNILEGASSDRERTRKLKELEEERDYRKLLQKQATEDRKNKLAMEKFLFRQELADMGATEGKSPDDLTGQLDSYLPPKKDITATDLGMGGSLDKQAYRPSFGLSSEPAPKGITLSSKNIGKFTGGGPVLGASPFEGKDAMDAIDRATKRGNVQTEMDETFELPDGTRMRIPSLLSRQAALRASTRKETVANADEDATTLFNRTRNFEEVRKATERKNVAKFLTPTQLKAWDAGVPLESLIVSATEQAKINATLAAAARQSLPSVSERKAGGLYSGARTALGALEKLVEDGYSPLNESYASRGAAAVGLGAVSRGLASTKGKLFRNEAERLITNYLYVTTGATSTAEELASQARQTTTDILDGPETFDQKMNFLRGKVGEMKIIAGRAAPDSSDEEDSYGGVTLIRKPR